MERTETELAAIAFLRKHVNLCNDVIIHSVRVSDLARALARQEGVDSKANLIALAALLHELHNCNHNTLYSDVCDFLASQGHTNPEISTVLSWILDAATKDSASSNLEASILWDANLIDDLGAIGLVTRFDKALISGVSFEAMLDELESRGTYVLENLITQTGQLYAADRIAFVTEYVERFHAEVRGDA